MLGTLRQKRNNPIVLVLLGLVALLMMSFGVSLQGFGTNPWAARVNGTEIKYEDFAQQYADAFRRRRERQQDYNSDQAKAEDLKQEVIDRMIAGKLLAQEAQRRGLVVDDDSLRKAIVELSVFHVNGTFSPEQYQRILRRVRQSPETFEKNFRDELLASQLSSLLQGITPSDAELLEVWNREQTKMSLSYVRFSKEDYVGLITPKSAEQLKAWAQKPESQKAIADFYEAQKPTRYEIQPQVCAKHILVKSPKSASAEDKAKHRASIKAAQDAIKGGLAFEEAAKKYSEDVTKDRGGDLSCFGKGQMLPAFENAAFGLEKDAISDIVETRFGLHIIQVYEKRPGISKTLDEVRMEIAAELANTEAAGVLAKQKAEELLKLAREKKSLAQAVEALGKTDANGKAIPAVTVQQTEKFPRRSAFIPGLGPALELQKLVWDLSSQKPLLDNVMELDNAWVAIEFLDREQPTAEEFQQAKLFLAYRFRAQKQTDIAERLVKSLRNQATIEINPLAVSYDASAQLVR